MPQRAHAGPRRAELDDGLIIRLSGRVQLAVVFFILFDTPGRRTQPGQQA